MKLSDLLADLPHKLVQGDPDVRVTTLSYDSRSVVPHSAFVALTGHVTDGHHHIAEAIESGASAVVVQNPREVQNFSTVIEVENSRVALAKMSSNYYSNPSAHLKLIGITGTNGKTSVSFLVRHILQQAGFRCGMIGTVEYDLGERVMPAARTTPESLDLHKYLNLMLDGGCSHVVMEVSSHALHQHRVHGLHFDTVAFTNLTRDHLDYHVDMEDYFLTKRKLFEASMSGGVISNIGDPYGVRIAEDFKGITVGDSELAQLQIQSMNLDQMGSRFLFAGVEFKIPLIGRHNVINTAMAIAISRQSTGISLEQCRESLVDVKPVPGRLEPIEEKQPFSVYIDYAHTDDALRNVLNALREVTQGRLLLVFGCGGNRDKGKRIKMGSVASELADLVTITTDNPRREDPLVIAKQITKGCSEIRNEGWLIELDRARAIDEALRTALPGDTVLIAGKGHEAYQEFDGTIIPFDDGEQVRATLRGMSSGES